MGLAGHWVECPAPAKPNVFRVVHAVQSIAPDKGRHHDDQTQSNHSWIEKQVGCNLLHRMFNNGANLYTASREQSGMVSAFRGEPSGAVNCTLQVR